MKKAQKTRLLRVGSLAMAAALLTACGSGTSSSSSAAASESASEAESVSSEAETAAADGPAWKNDTSPVDLEWFVGASWYGYTWGESVVSKNITEKTGVNVTITTPTDDVSTELSLYMVSGDLPDIITLGNWESCYTSLYEQGYVYALNELADQYDPYFYNVVDGDVIKWHTKDDGNVYCIPNDAYAPSTMAETGQTAAVQTFLVRKDLYEEMGSPDMTTPEGFYYDVAYRKADGKPIPVHFMQRQTPDFLEGTVRRLKLNDDTATKEALCRSVRGSALYDRELKMYRVNTSLSDASFELGRAVAFTPGWLENGSIWLHMEYKYLLEMLRAGLYAAFFEDFRNAAIPFLDPERYGRSTLENSSFLVSSLNPDESLHGRGFVARLSGSTVEFLHMWRIMMFGESPFSSSQKGLTLAFRPAIPAYLIGKDKMIAATFLGRTQVEYHFDAIQDYIPGAYSMSEAEMTFHDGAVKRSREILGDDAEAVREGLAAKIVMRLTSKP